MISASEASLWVEEALQKLSEEGWSAGNLPCDENGRQVRLLYYERAFLMWMAGMEEIDGTYIGLIDKVHRRDEAFAELPGNMGMGVNAVLNAHPNMSDEAILTDILESLPRRVCAARDLSVGPDTYFRQIGMSELGFKREN